MFMRPLSHSEIREMIARDDAIQGHQPRCPECDTDQVQIKFKGTPARWKCRRCKHWFTSEPSASVTAGNQPTAKLSEPHPEQTDHEKVARMVCKAFQPRLVGDPCVYPNCACKGPSEVADYVLAALAAGAQPTAKGCGE